MRSKKKRSDDAALPDLVQIMTVSLFIILLAFFILLNTIAVFDEQKKLAVLDSLLGNFGALSGGESLLKGREGTTALPQVDKISSYVDFSDFVTGADDLIQHIRVRSNHRGTVLSIPASLLFSEWGVHLIPSGETVLDRLCRTMAKNDYPVEIVGHTDNRPPLVSDGVSNRELSALRAMNSLNYILRRGGFRQTRFTAYGWGGYRPIVTNRTKETRELNRRMDIVFIHDRSPKAPGGVFTFKKFFFEIFDSSNKLTGDK
jgi:chemotaxis protein MotB